MSISLKTQKANIVKCRAKTGRFQAKMSHFPKKPQANLMQKQDIFQRSKNEFDLCVYQSLRKTTQNGYVLATADVRPLINLMMLKVFGFVKCRLAAAGKEPFGHRRSITTAAAASDFTMSPSGGHLLHIRRQHLLKHHDRHSEPSKSDK